jgi:hypothetical protein
VADRSVTPADRAALEIGRLFMRAHAAEQQAEALAQEVKILREQLAAQQEDKPTK